MNAKSALLQDQNQLFVMPPQNEDSRISSDLKTWHDAEKIEIPDQGQTSEQVVCTVNIVDHYRAQKQTLLHFGTSNEHENDRQRHDEGLGFVVENKKPGKTREESQRLMDLFDKKASESFAKSFGKSVLIESGVLSEDEAEALTKDAYKDYSSRYSGIDNKAARKRKLRRTNNRIDRLES